MNTDEVADTIEQTVIPTTLNPIINLKSTQICITIENTITCMCCCEEFLSCKQYICENIQKH